MLLKAFYILLLSASTIFTMQGQVTQSSDTPTSTEERKEYEDHFNQRYVFTNSAIPIPEGRAYYSTFNGILHTIHYGISDYVSTAIGSEFISILAGYSPIIYIAPKLSVPIVNENYLGISYQLAYNIEEKESVGLVQVMYTFGTSNKNITIGYNLTTGEFDPPNNHWSIDMTYPLSRKFQLIAGTFSTHFGQIHSVGIHMKTKYNAAYQFAAIISQDSFDAYVIPAISVFAPLNFRYRKKKIKNLKTDLPRY